MSESAVPDLSEIPEDLRPKFEKALREGKRYVELTKGEWNRLALSGGFLYAVSAPLRVSSRLMNDSDEVFETEYDLDSGDSNGGTVDEDKTNMEARHRK